MRKLGSHKYKGLNGQEDLAALTGERGMKGLERLGWMQVAPRGYESV